MFFIRREDSSVSWAGSISKGKSIVKNFLNNLGINYFHWLSMRYSRRYAERVKNIITSLIIHSFERISLTMIGRSQGFETYIIPLPYFDG